MTSSPFSEAAELGPARLRPFAQKACGPLAGAIVDMAPWAAMGYGAAGMARYLAATEDGARRYAIMAGDRCAGAAVVRYPWLAGPYVELVAVLPDFQSQGIGSAFLAWFEREALARQARNLWLCASRGNAGALRFYARHGFTETASLPGLVADGFDEVLLRKFPIGGPSRR